MASSTPPASSAGFERAQSATDRSQTPSRRTSEMQPIDAGAANAGAVSNGLDVPYQAQSASWDTVDFASARGASPGFPYTPSYRDSFTPYGSESGISWTGGHGESGDPIYDEPLDGTSNDVEYNPADFDGPNSHSNMASPYYLDHPQQDPRSGSIGSSEYGGYNSDQTLVHNNDHYGSHSRSFSNDNIRGGTPHARMNSLDVNSFSPRPYNAPSPASSVGGLDVERPRSRASSISSSHGPMPSLTVGPMGEAFDKLGFDSVDSDIMWRNQQQQQQQQQGVAKAQSPPSLMIPSDGPSSTLQIPSFGSHHQATLGAGLNTGALGGLSAPGINILPATPVSGGAGAAHVPFDTVLKNLNDRRQHQHQQQQQQQQQQHSSSPSNVMNLVGDNSSEPMHSTSFAAPATTSRPSTPVPASSSSSGTFGTNNYPFVPSSSAAVNTYQFPSIGSSNPLSPATAQALDNFLATPGSSNHRPRALSDTSIRPTMTTVESHPIMPPFLGGPPSLTSSPGHFSPSLSSHTPPLSSMGRSLANHRSNSFGASSDMGVHFNPSHDAAFNGLDVGLGADLRRARFDTRHRPSRSEDFRAASPFQPPDYLAPSSAYGQSYGYVGQVRSHDSLMAGVPSSIGPARHGRRLSSGSPYPDQRSGSVSSARPSPYPSPNGSPSHMHQGLPPNGLEDDHMGGPNPWSKVERQQVTTPATAKASEGRRKGEASFVCPVPGCGSTFTRHFNLKGHLRSHNEERPFKCKWPGCEKGFARQHDCKRHEALHLNLRPYTCEGCKKTFARMDALNRHRTCSSNRMFDQGLTSILPLSHSQI
ncbi:hypothetical protein FRC15_009644 [Serendipita sp. 397]|nr:hypothetical protein FRC15_009644 [Serendipita sp. 397]